MLAEENVVWFGFNGWKHLSEFFVTNSLLLKNLENNLKKLVPLQELKSGAKSKKVNTEI